MNKYLIPILIFSIIVIGFFATIAQVTILREFLIVFYGNELCVGFIFGSWLAGVTLGAAISGKLASKISSHTFHLKVFIFTLLIMCLMLPLHISLLRVFRYILEIPTGEFVPFSSLFWSSAFIITPFSATVGFIFPFACTIFTGITKENATDIGSVYILEGVGALIGGMIFTFVLVSRVSSFEIMAILTLAILFTLILLSFYLNRSSLQKSIIISCAILFTLCFSLFIFNKISYLDNFLIKKRWNSFSENIELIESNDSKYHNLVIGKQEEQYNVYINGQYDFSFPDQYGYAQIANLIMTQHPNPKQVLLIGGGLGGLIKEILKHDVKKLDYVEFDPQLINITKKYLQPSNSNVLFDKRVTIFNIDGRYFVKQAEDDKYDLIFSNTPDPSTALLNRFYTLEFFQEIRRCLKKDGVFATHISSSINYMGDDVSNYTGSIYYTLSNTFPFINVSPGQRNYFFCSNESNVTTFNVETLINRYKERNIKSDHFSEFAFYTILQPEEVTLVKNLYKKITNPRLNTDIWPITYFFNLVLWDQFSGGTLSMLFKQLEDIKLTFFLIPIFLLLLIRLIYVRLKKIRLTRNNQQKQMIIHNAKTARFNSFITILCIGFAGIAVEIIIIFAFQNIYGYIYEKIGLIIALFMFGLTIGGFFANKLVIKCEKGYYWTKAAQPRLHETQIFWSKVLIAVEIATVSFTLLLPFIIKIFSYNWTGSQYIYFILITFSGILTGIGFPIAIKLYLQSMVDDLKGQPTNNSTAIASVNTNNSRGVKKLPAVIIPNASFVAGIIDSADHLGALIGAIFTGIIFVPLFGLAGSCLIVAMLNLGSAILLIYFVIRNR